MEWFARRATRRGNRVSPLWEIGAFRNMPRALEAIEGAFAAVSPREGERKARVTFTLAELADLVRGAVRGDGDLRISGARSLHEANPGDITFVENEKYARQLGSSRASAVLIKPNPAAEIPESLARIEVADPLMAFVEVVRKFRGAPGPSWRGIHPTAVIAGSAKIDPGVTIHPLCHVGEGVEIGEGTVLHAGVVVRENCRIGRNCEIHPNVTLYPDVSVGDRVIIHAGCVLGGDGFGYRTMQGRHVKIPQLGGVVIEDDVEIGCNCTIDRGTFDDTRIGAGTKIDNLVMIGHNNRIGRHNLLCGQVGMAGSCSTGDHVVMAGQAGIKDHVEIGDRVIVGAQAGVHRNIPSDQSVLGAPAIPVREQRQLFAMIARLPEMHRQLKELTARLAALDGGSVGEGPGEGGEG